MDYKELIVLHYIIILYYVILYYFILFYMEVSWEEGLLWGMEKPIL